jgi:hypothetical protein
MIVAAAVMLLGMVMPGMAAWETVNGTQIWMPPVLQNYNNPWDGTRVFANAAPVYDGNTAGQMKGFDDPWMNIDTREKFMYSGVVNIGAYNSSYELTATQMKDVPLGKEGWMEWV